MILSVVVVALTIAAAVVVAAAAAVVEVEVEVEVVNQKLPRKSNLYSPLHTYVQVRTSVL